MPKYGATFIALSTKKSITFPWDFRMNCPILAAQLIFRCLWDIIWIKEPKKKKRNIVWPVFINSYNWRRNFKSIDNFKVNHNMLGHTQIVLRQPYPVRTTCSMCLSSCSRTKIYSLGHAFGKLSQPEFIFQNLREKT